jgi:hypothetical protein
MHTAPSPDPKLLHEGLLLIEGMSMTAIAARRNTCLSKSNREFYERKQAALDEVARCARLGAKVEGALHG